MGCESLGFGVLRLALVFEPAQQPRRRFIVWLVVASLLSVSFVFQVQRIGAQEKVRIAPSSPGLAAWPMHLAAREGFFVREGLNPEIIVMRTNTGIAALVTGSIDFTTAGGSAMRAAVNGAPIKMILNVNKKADLWILAQKNIPRVEDLRGKMIGVGGNWGTQFYQVLEALRPNGIDKDVQLVSTGDVANGFLSLQQGSMPAVALTPPYSILAKRQGYRDLVHTGDVIGVSPTTALVTTKDKLEREPQKIRRTIRAVMRAVEFAKTRRAEMIQFIIRQYKMEREVADSVYDALMDTLNPTLSLTDQEVQVELNRIAEQSKAKLTVKPADVVDFGLVKQVANEATR
jgi:ABC-type nitrate/sulfonate/bicarbonate transport system substrate-binding protein